MKSITDFSLKFQIYWFYLLLGFVPLLVVSYFCVQAYIQSIETLTDRHVTQMVQQVAGQADLRLRHAWQDFGRMAQLPYIQRFFHEFHDPLRMDSIREKLEQTRVQAGFPDMLALFSNQGELLVLTAAADSPLKDGAFVREAMDREKLHDGFWQLMGDASGRRIVFFSRVYAFQSQMRPVGYLMGDIPMAYIVDFLKRLDINRGTVKTIQTGSGQMLYTQTSSAFPQPDQRRMRTYKAALQSMNWQISVRIPEQELFADLRRLLLRTFSFTTVIVLLAGAASLLFSRRFMRPFEAILNGFRAFAAGDLDHRIAIQKGPEAKRLARGFNHMAEQLKVRQIQLIQSNKLAALGLMAAGIAHEIKNPLAGIKTSAQVIDSLVAESCREPAEVFSSSKGGDICELADGIVSEVNRLTKIVQDLLEFGRPGPAQKNSCDLSVIIMRAVSLLQKEIKKKNITVENRVPAFTVVVDPDQTLQIFINLMLNAIANIDSASGRICIDRFRVASGTYGIAVTDNGRGIAEDKLEQIFDPFFSLTQGGTGLGLSVVYTLLQQNDIHVEVTSQLNKGTTFMLTFGAGTMTVKEEADAGHRHCG